MTSKAKRSFMEQENSSVGRGATMSSMVWVLVPNMPTWGGNSATLLFVLSQMCVYWLVVAMCPKSDWLLLTNDADTCVSSGFLTPLCCL